jgi:uncharacterized iron-regulated membrane protein
MRKVHRWLMTVFAVFLIYLTGSGLVVSIYDVLDPQQGWAQEGGGPGKRESDVSAVAALPDEAALQQLLPQVTDAVRQALNDAPITSIELRIRDDALQAAVLSGGEAPRQLILTLDNGELRVLSVTPIKNDPSRPDGIPPDALVPGGIGTAAPANGESLHGYIESWHRMVFMGQGVSRFIGLLSAMALIVMVITGTSYYLQMRWHRRDSGRSGWFWR